MANKINIEYTCPECGEGVIDKFDIDKNGDTFKYFQCGDCGYEF